MQIRSISDSKILKVVGNNPLIPYVAINGRIRLDAAARKARKTKQ
jgi:hypothetical protein